MARTKPTPKAPKRKARHYGAESDDGRGESQRYRKRTKLELRFDIAVSSSREPSPSPIEASTSTAHPRIPLLGRLTSPSAHQVLADMSPEVDIEIEHDVASEPPCDDMIVNDNSSETVELHPTYGRLLFGASQSKKSNKSPSPAPSIINLISDDEEEPRHKELSPLASGSHTGASGSNGYPKPQISSADANRQTDGSTLEVAAVPACSPLLTATSPPPI